MAGRTVDPRYLPFSMAVPANTLSTAPQSLTHTLGDLVIMSLQLTIPTGHSGLTGFQMRTAGETIIPWGRPTDWIIADGVVFEFELDFQAAASFTTRAYNEDSVYAHTFYGRWKVRSLDVPSSSHSSRPIVPISVPAQ